MLLKFFLQYLHTAIVKVKVKVTERGYGLKKHILFA